LPNLGMFNENTVLETWTDDAHEVVTVIMWDKSNPEVKLVNELTRQDLEVMLDSMI